MSNVLFCCAMTRGQRELLASPACSKARFAAKSGMPGGGLHRGTLHPKNPKDPAASGPRSLVPRKLVAERNRKSEAQANERRVGKAEDYPVVSREPRSSVNGPGIISQRLCQLWYPRKNGLASSE
jgi:hypothetical protein